MRLEAHVHTPPAAIPGGHEHAAAPRLAAQRAADRGTPAPSLLGTSLATRLGVCAGALAVLWLTILWALR
ncbi:hypothetical protein ACFQ4M_00825 [Thauera mechernichensis]|uniref:Uncharacterized protein n=1 Tax=Thauera mechernichensis TaxID=82788 RepID=A0ABW3W9D5_9RHOO|nr:hypothetical protein [Thauera mechernichensis]MDG3063525.1 hypothetical protein [Thauera mechernichensis]